MKKNSTPPELVVKAHARDLEAAERALDATIEILDDRWAGTHAFFLGWTRELLRSLREQAERSAAPCEVCQCVKCACWVGDRDPVIGSDDLLDRLDESIGMLERDAATTRNELRALKKFALEIHRDVYQGEAARTQAPTLDESENQ